MDKKKELLQGYSTNLKFRGRGKKESQWGYSTNLKFRGREKRITAGILNKFIIQWMREIN